MTTLEVLKAIAALNYPISDETYSATLINNDLDPTAEYVKSSDQRSLELSIADLALTLVLSVKQLQDDGYSVTMQDVAELWKLRRFWRNKWGLPDDEPKPEVPRLYDASKKW